jgi:hypothetical protein
MKLSAVSSNGDRIEFECRDGEPMDECMRRMMRPPQDGVAAPSRARPGLGDMLKAGLSAVGITEERVSRLVGRPCGCGQRAAKMNEFGAKYLGLPPGSQNSEATKRDGTQ